MFIKDLFVEIKNFDEVELDQEILHLDSKVIFIHNYWIEVSDKGSIEVVLNEVIQDVIDNEEINNLKINLLLGIEKVVDDSNNHCLGMFEKL